MPRLCNVARCEFLASPSQLDHEQEPDRRLVSFGRQLRRQSRRNGEQVIAGNPYLSEQRIANNLRTDQRSGPLLVFKLFELGAIDLARGPSVVEGRIG